MYITDIYYINLDHRIDKKENIEKHLNNAPSYMYRHRISGVMVNPQDIINKKCRYKDITIDKDVFARTAGCYLSHLKIYDLIKQKSYPVKSYSLILEDDVGILNNFWNQIESLKLNIRPDLIFFDIDHLKRNTDHIQPVPKGDKNFAGTHCYAISNRRINKIQRIFAKAYEKELNHIDLSAYNLPRLKTFHYQTNSIYIETIFGSDRLNCSEEEYLSKVIFLQNAYN